MSMNGMRTVASIYHEARKMGWRDPGGSNDAEVDVIGDIWSSRRFAEKHRGKLIFDFSTRSWFSYEDGIWRKSSTGEEVRAGKLIADSIFKEAAEAFDTQDTNVNKKRLASAANLHGNARRIEAMIKLAAAEHGMSVPDASWFDRDPWKVGVPGGAVDLRTGRFLEPSPDMMISKMTGAQFNPDATCPRWEAALQDIFRDKSIVDFVKVAAGYSLSGCVDEEVLFFAYGSGANGKSLFANVISAVFGDYALTIGSEVLAKTKHESEAARGKVRLPGSRLALVNEVGQGDIWNDQRIKEIVSRERISARHLYGEAFDFFPTHTLWVRGNHLPAILDAGDGMWRRIIVIPFRRQFAPEERIPDLDRTLIQEEGSGILNWLLEGCREYLETGLNPPQEIRDMISRYREDSDIVGEWISAHCETGAGEMAGTSELYNSYRQYHLEMSMQPKTQPSFVRMMTQRGFAKKPSNGRYYFHGIRLLKASL